MDWYKLIFDMLSALTAKKEIIIKVNVGVDLEIRDKSNGIEIEPL